MQLYRLRRGAGVVIEQKEYREMFWMEWSYYAFEIMLQEVIFKSNEVSIGPDTLMFKRFINLWNSVDNDF